MSQDEVEKSWTQVDRRKQAELFSEPITFQDIDQADVPPDIFAKLEGLRKSHFLPEKAPNMAYKDFSYARDKEGVEVYVGRLTNELLQHSQECHCVLQVKDGIPVGYSWFALRYSEDWKKTFLATDDTETLSGYFNAGYALKRLFEMNQYSFQKYAQPLHSDRAIVSDARRLWQRLVRYGMASEVVEGANQRYVFNSPK